MDYKIETPIISGVGQQPTERVQTPTYSHSATVSPRLIQTVQETPVAVFLYDPSASYAVASSKKADVRFGTPKNVLDIFADSDPKMQLRMAETTGHNLDDLEVPLKEDQGYATASLRHNTNYATHLVLLYLTALRKPAEPEFDMSCFTPRERDIVDLLKVGRNNEQIANGTGLTGGTVRNHISRICEKVGVGDRTQVVAKLKK